MYLDNKMRKRGSEGGQGVGVEKEWGRWKGGKNELEKLLGKVKKIK